MTPQPISDATASLYLNLADARLGAVALSATDDFFAPVSRMLDAHEPQWREGVYDDHGKWMDGWESRRRRGSGHDFCVIRLAAPATLFGFDIDTRHFTGNYPPQAAIQACNCDKDPDAGTIWEDLLPIVALKGNSHNFFTIESARTWTHLRLHIYPDGGVARLRAYGRVQPSWERGRPDAIVDLAAALNGGRALACSDEHYGAMANLLLPGRGASMADGWETRRRREPGFDWVILQLGCPGIIERVEIDTAFFRGNFPHQVSVQGARVPAGLEQAVASSSLYWETLLEPQLLRADAVHEFASQLRALGALSHVRVNIHPDGGLSRVRLFGKPQRE